MAAATLSPRISFSHDIDLSPPTTAADVPRRLDSSMILTSPPSSSSSDDFDFSTSHEFSTATADELFAHGMLLPLSSIKTPATAVTHRQKIDTESEKKPESPREDVNLNYSSSPPHTKPPPPPSSSSFWANIGRSSSVGMGSKSSLASICPFPRSKSTGSYQNQNQNQNQSKKTRNLSRSGQSQSQIQSQNTKNWYNYYYSRSSKRSSHSNGVRINPVINVPTHFIPRGGSSSSGGSNNTTSSSGDGGNNGGGSNNSFFAYLLCNCRDKSCKELENFSP